MSQYQSHSSSFLSLKFKQDVFKITIVFISQNRMLVNMLKTYALNLWWCYSIQTQLWVFFNLEICVTLDKAILICSPDTYSNTTRSKSILQKLFVIYLSNKFKVQSKAEGWVFKLLCWLWFRVLDQWPMNGKQLIFILHCPGYSGSQSLKILLLLDPLVLTK